MVNDTISDMLTRIRNANMVKHQIVQIPSTKISLAIVEILKEEGDDPVCTDPKGTDRAAVHATIINEIAGELGL